MSDFSGWTRVDRTRKEHICTGCLQPIRSGSKAWKYAVRYQGHFHDGHMCVPCHDFILEYPDDWESYTPGDVGEARKEAARYV